MRLQDFESVGCNLWKQGSTYYRLYAHSITPNGCWLAAPEMRELLDIDTATGKDVYGPGVLPFPDAVGTVPACYQYETKAYRL